jgi:lysyl-tRNA synthetase class 1
MTEDISFLAKTSQAWPFQEARELLEVRLKNKIPQKGFVLFETGYGPSGLPHIGTFGEVARTTMVRRAFECLAPSIPTKLYAFSDDRDGLRKIPDNIPNKDRLIPHLGKPLTSIPDPFELFNSFGDHNNAKLRGFLDSFGFSYEFQSATEWYLSGRFDEGCLAILRHYEEIMEVMLPTLGEERQKSYSPFLPVCPDTGLVLQVPILRIDVERHTILYKNDQGIEIETLVTGGQVKLQWKADWAMRWYVLDVDYEMSGKDLIPSYQLASRICKILGGTPPLNLSYELFLDEKGQKVSKSKGNGLSIEEWLRYAPPESLSLYMYQKPKTAKRLYFDIIPRAVEDYLTFLEKYSLEDQEKRLNNPVWHIHQGYPPAPETGLSFSILLNLASVCHAEDRSVIWHFIRRYTENITPETSPFLDRLVDYAVTYYQDLVKPHKKYRLPSDHEKKALEILVESLDLIEKNESLDDQQEKAILIQNKLYDIGNNKELFSELKQWFQALYEILLGQDQGPRMGSFIALYGLAETRTLIKRVLSGEDLSR